MTKADELKVNALIHRLGLKYNIRDCDIKEIIESQFRFIQKTIVELDLTEEELKTNFIIKYIGKLYIEEKTINKLKNGNKEEF